MDLPTMGPMSEQDMIAIIRLYRILLSSGIPTKHLTKRKVDRVLKEALRAYPGWIDVAAFMDDERNALACSQRG